MTPPSTQSRNRSQKRLQWKVFAALMVASRLAALASIPYIKTLARKPSEPLGVLLVGGVVQAVLTAVLVGAGLWVGPQVGHFRPQLRTMLVGNFNFERRGFYPLLWRSLVAGIAVGVVLLLIDLTSKQLIPSYPHPPTPPPWQGFLAAFNGAINEELWMRLGIMTIFVWVGSIITQVSPPHLAIVWTANVLTAFAYGVFHLVSQTTFGPLDTVIVVSVLLGNGIAGVVYGWFYWRQGLLAAIVAHWSTEIVLHVVAPTLQ